MLTSSLRTPSPHRADMGTAYVTVAPFRGVDVMCGCVPNSGPSPPMGQSSVLLPREVWILFLILAKPRRYR